MKIAAQRHEELLAKERAHDDYLAAIRSVRELAAKHELQVSSERVEDPELTSFARGYRRALKDFSLAVLRAHEARRDETEIDREERVRG